MTKPEFGVGDLVDCTITGTNLIAACVDHRTYMVNQLCVKVTGDRDLVQVSGWVYFFDGFPHGVEERYLRPHNPPSNTEDTAYTTFKSTLDFTRIKEGEIA